jgi:hypothetical protein
MKARFDFPNGAVGEILCSYAGTENNALFSPPFPL